VLYKIKAFVSVALALFALGFFLNSHSHSERPRGPEDIVPYPGTGQGRRSMRAGA